MIISGTISSPTTLPQSKTCLGAPSGFQLQSSAAPSLAPASGTGKGIKQKKTSWNPHLGILYPTNIN